MNKLFKKLSVCLVAMALVLGLAPSIAFADGSTLLYLSNHSPSVGDKFTVTVTATKEDTITVYYTTDVLTLQGCSVTYTADSNYVTFTGTEATITYYAAASGKANVIVEGTEVSGCSVVVQVASSGNESTSTDTTEADDAEEEEVEEEVIEDETAEEEAVSEVDEASESTESTEVEASDEATVADTTEDDILDDDDDTVYDSNAIYKEKYLFQVKVIAGMAIAIVILLIIIINLLIERRRMKDEFEIERDFFGIGVRADESVDDEPEEEEEDDDDGLDPTAETPVPALVAYSAKKDVQPEPVKVAEPEPVKVAEPEPVKVVASVPEVSEEEFLPTPMSIEELLAEDDSFDDDEAYELELAQMAAKSKKKKKDVKILDLNDL